MTEPGPKRIQLRRTKGWRKPEGAVVVSRPSKWGNPFIGENAARDFRRFLRKRMSQGEIVDRFGPISGLGIIVLRTRMLTEIAELAGKDLCCWCGLDAACHADVLLELANDAGGSQ